MWSQQEPVSLRIWDNLFVLVDVDRILQCTKPRTKSYKFDESELWELLIALELHNIRGNLCYQHKNSLTQSIEKTLPVYGLEALL